MENDITRHHVESFLIVEMDTNQGIPRYQRLLDRKSDIIEDIVTRVTRPKTELSIMENGLLPLDDIL